MTNLETSQKNLIDACSQLGLQTSVSLMAILPNGRWVLDFEQDPNFPNFSHGMIKLERKLKEMTGNDNIDLICEGIEDKNKRDVKTGRTNKLVSARLVESLEV